MPTFTQFVHPINGSLKQSMVGVARPDGATADALLDGLKMVWNERGVDDTTKRP